MASSTTKTIICNMAVSHLGNGQEIQDLDTDRSQEAQACRRFYDQARQATLRDFPWPFAKKTVALSLITSDPSPDWFYSYQYPSDCLEFHKILSCISNDTRQSRVPYNIVYGANGNEIYTNRQNAYGEYTVDVTNESRFSPDFVMALSFRIASYIAPRLTKGDPYKLGDKAAQRYLLEISRAAATAVNEEQQPQDPDSEFIRYRE